MKTLLRALGGFLAGYFAVVLLTTLGFNVWLGKQPTPEDGFLLVVAGTMVAVLSGVAGGFLAASIGGNFYAGLAVAAPLIVESTWLLFLRHRAHPATWYHILGACILVTSTIAGALISRIRPFRPRPSSAPSS